MEQSKRKQMIEEEAYHRSQQPGYSGDALENWLAAEKEVDRRLAEQGGGKKEELAAFARLQQEMSRLLTAMKGSLREENFREALDKAVGEVKGLGEFTTESVNKAAEALRKDMARNIEKLRGAWHSVSLKTAGQFVAWSRRGVKFLREAEEATEAWLKKNKERVRPHTYHTGDIATAGTFICKACTHPLKLEETGHLPRCPQCDHTEFKIETSS